MGKILASKLVVKTLTALSALAFVCVSAPALAQQGAPAPPVEEEPPPADSPIPPAYTQTDAQPPPPPGYGNQPPPPPGYGPPPDPYNYGVPQGTPPNYDTDDWEEGDPIPPGYREDTRVRKGLVIGGAVTLGALWVVSVLTAGIAVSIEEAENDLNGGLNPDSVGPEDYYPLFIPAVGPFITIATTESSGAGTAFLIIDGVAQSGGLAMLIAGLAAQETYIRPAPNYGEIDVKFAPVVAPGFTGMGVNGTF